MDDEDDDYNVKKMECWGRERRGNVQRDFGGGGGRRGRPTPTGDRLRLEYIASG